MKQLSKKQANKMRDYHFIKISNTKINDEIYVHVYYKNNKVWKLSNKCCMCYKIFPA